MFFGNAKNKTSISFDVMPYAKEEKYAIRLSSIYKWYSDNVNQVLLIPETDKSITVLKIQVTKGN